MQYKLMALEHGQKVTLKLKKGVVPYIFQCQKKDNLWPPPERKGAIKRKRQALVQEALAEAALTEAYLRKAGPSTASISEADLLAAGPSTASISEADILAAGPSTASISEADLLAAGPSTASVPYHIPNIELKISDNKTDGEAVSNILSKAHSTDMLQFDKAVQVNCKVPYRSKGVNVNLSVKKNNIALSPFSISSRNTSTSPLKSAHSSIKRKLFTDNPADSASLTSVNSQYSVISTDYEPERSSSDSSWLIEDELDSDIQFKNLMRSGTLIAIEKEPKMFLDGLVNYISDGYSGRATDLMIVENCGFLDHLPPQKAVMADRGFKDLTRLLAIKNCSLVRPPSVSQSTPSTKEDVKKSKQIAALRINVERVIGRLREFNMLLPHACIDHHLIQVVDEVIIIACGLINLQDVLIKK
ncbi:unnamed protein product [Arctia plantaginis]|uniref:DDE Tnp4 domain-containing protein n=1 Tax=Arctia plantaginis TaxID=874455 RepID=A0A8S1BH00_ARCPL|nr:unnamed protein product [Arctia plantaginis]